MSYDNEEVENSFKVIMKISDYNPTLKKEILKYVDLIKEETKLHIDEEIKSKLNLSDYSLKFNIDDKELFKSDIDKSLNELRKNIEDKTFGNREFKKSFDKYIEDLELLSNLIIEKLRRDVKVKEYDFIEKEEQLKQLGIKLKDKQKELEGFIFDKVKTSLEKELNEIKEIERRLKDFIFKYNNHFSFGENEDNYELKYEIESMVKSPNFEKFLTQKIKKLEDLELPEEIVKEIKNEVLLNINKTNNQSISKKSIMYSVFSFLMGSAVSTSIVLFFLKGF